MIKLSLVRIRRAAACWCFARSQTVQRFLPFDVQTFARHQARSNDRRTLTHLSSRGDASHATTADGVPSTAGAPLCAAQTAIQPLLQLLTSCSASRACSGRVSGACCLQLKDYARVWCGEHCVVLYPGRCFFKRSLVECPPCTHLRVKLILAWRRRLCSSPRPSRKLSLQPAW